MVYLPSGFGERYHPVYHKEVFHTGINLKANHEIEKTIATGIIVKQGYDGRLENYLIWKYN